VRMMTLQNMKFQQETRASNQNQMGHMATQLNQAQVQNSDKLPSQTMENPRNVSSIILRSRKKIEVPTLQPTPQMEVDPTTLQRKHDAHTTGPSTSSVPSTPSTSTIPPPTPFLSLQKPFQAIRWKRLTERF